MTHELNEFKCFSLLKSQSLINKRFRFMLISGVRITRFETISGILELFSVRPRDLY